MTHPAAAAALIAREPAVQSLRGVPRRWYQGNAVWTHAANRAFVAATEIELFVVRVFRQVLSEGVLEDEALREQVRGFIRQEGTHARYHMMVYDQLRHQGYEIDSLLQGLRAEMKAIEQRASLEELLSMVAAAEHHFTSVGAWLLENHASLDIPEEIRALLVWHGAEEIEHQAIAHDVYRACFAPTYLQRLRGYVRIGRLFRGIVTQTFAHLLRQEAPALSRREVRRQMLSLLVVRYPSLLASQAVNALHYLKPGFHPLDRDYSRLAEAHFAATAYRVQKGA